MATHSFKDLIVWQKSMALAQSVYGVSRILPFEERQGIVSQVQRAVVSIPSNIAEGSKRGSRKEFAHFLRIARGSAAELETQLLIIRAVYTINVEEQLSLLVEVQKMLEVLLKNFLRTEN